MFIAAFKEIMPNKKDQISKSILKSLSDAIEIGRFISNEIIASVKDKSTDLRIDQATPHLNSAGFDDWGLDPKTLKATIPFFKWLYRDYFRVKTQGIENIPDGRVMLVANHGGQLPVDGALLSLSMILDAPHPRVARGMVEKWFPKLPFISTFLVRCGNVLGDSRNCIELLQAEQCVMVFPEGVKGLGKPFKQRYQLQTFGTGFVRIALSTKTPIIPVGIIGCEEAYPGLTHLERLAKLLGLPYLPVTPIFPLLGPLGLLPLPTQVTLSFGEPFRFDTNPDAPDSEILPLVEAVKSAINKQIQTELNERSAPIHNTHKHTDKHTEG